MKTLLVLLLSICGSQISFGQNNQLVIANEDSIYSIVLGETRKLWIHLPNNYEEDGAINRKYPVLYLLDGDSHMFSAVGIMSKRSGRIDLLPDMIVVGIQNTNNSRLRDFTSTVTSGFPKTGETGGGEAFTSFIGNELIPYIDRKYHTAPYRTLIGSSLAGLFVINTLINNPQIFDSYLAIDPSMWYDDQKLMKQADTILNEVDFAEKSLYLGVARTWDPRSDTFNVQSMILNDDMILQDGLFEGIKPIHAKSILHLAKSIERNSKNNLNFRWKYYPNENHPSVGLIALFDGLNFLFNWYQLNLLDQLKSTIYNEAISPDSIVNLINEHYKFVSLKMGYEVIPPSRITTGSGYDCLHNKFYDKAISLFNMSIENFPSNDAGYMAIGRLFKEQGDIDKAIEYYKLSLEMNPGNEELKKEIEGINAANKH